MSAAINFIALFGIAVMDGISILSQYNQLIDEADAGRDPYRKTAIARPVLMTCVVAGIRLLPAAISEGIGSQVQKPLAIVVVTGMMLASLVMLVTLPVVKISILAPSQMIAARWSIWNSGVTWLIFLPAGVPGSRCGQSIRDAVEPVSSCAGASDIDQRKGSDSHAALLGTPGPNRAMPEHVRSRDPQMRRESKCQRRFTVGSLSTSREAAR